jgi:hypothetical protein
MASTIREYPGTVGQCLGSQRSIVGLTNKVGNKDEDVLLWVSLRISDMTVCGAITIHLCVS